MYGLPVGHFFVSPLTLTVMLKLALASLSTGYCSYHTSTNTVLPRLYPHFGMELFQGYIRGGDTTEVYHVGNII